MNATIALLVALAGNLVYHLAMRTAPKDTGAFALLGVAYLIAGIASLGIAMKFEGATAAGISRALHVNTAVLAVAVLAIEAGYLLAYRRGAAISSASLLVNASVATALVLIGWFVFRERLSGQALLGIIVTGAGVLTLATAPAASAPH